MSTQTENSALKNAEIPLTELKPKQRAIVSHIVAGRRATHRLSGLGITIGTPIKLVSQAPFHGPVQIEIRETRLAIGRGLAQKVLVSKK